MKINQAVSQTANEFLVMVPRPQDQVPVESEYPERVKESDLLWNSFMCSWKLIQDGPIEAVINRIQWQALRSSFGLKT